MRHPSRRGLIGGGVAAAAGAVAGAAVGMTLPSDDDAPTTSSAPMLIDPTGSTQAGVDRPAIPQVNTLIAVVNGRPNLPALGTQILALHDGERAEVLPDGPGDLTVLVGVGEPMIGYASDGDELLHSSGDLLLMISATDPISCELALPSLLAHVEDADLLWTERGHRGNRPDGLSRNPLGFLDGIVIPRTEEEVAADVWTPEHTTHCVIRRFRIDLDRWSQLSVERQEQVIGRRRIDGAPLSGGSTTDQIDTGAKAADGSYLVPARSHARAAHPSFTGSELMLRRSYPFADRDAQGLLFISFQRELATFEKTQQRMDETDDLMAFITATASGAFRILPGFDHDRPLGS